MVVAILPAHKVALSSPASCPTIIPLPSRRAHVSGPSKRHRVDGGGDTALEFGRSRVLLRQRQLLVDGVLVELGARAFDLLMALLEADGALNTKDKLLDQVWPASWCRKRT